MTLLIYLSIGVSTPGIFLIVYPIDYLCLLHGSKCYKLYHIHTFQIRSINITNPPNGILSIEIVSSGFSFLFSIAIHLHFLRHNIHNHSLVPCQCRCSGVGYLQDDVRGIGFHYINIGVNTKRQNG
jgi:hypothetical protein